jgi:hypothetical protein
MTRDGSANGHERTRTQTLPTKLLRNSCRTRDDTTILQPCQFKTVRSIIGIQPCQLTHTSAVLKRHEKRRCLHRHAQQGRSQQQICSAINKSIVHTRNNKNQERDRNRRRNRWDSRVSRKRKRTCCVVFFENRKRCTNVGVETSA